MTLGHCWLGDHQDGTKCAEPACKARSQEVRTLADGCCLWKNVNVDIDLIQLWAHYTWKLLVNEKWKKTVAEQDHKLKRCLHPGAWMKMDLLSILTSIWIRICHPQPCWGRSSFQKQPLIDLDGEFFQQAAGAARLVHLHTVLVKGQFQNWGHSAPGL